MRATHWQKFLAAATCLAALSLALSGCTATLTAVGVHVAESRALATETAGKPQAGDCWRATYSTVVRYADWGKSGPVPCRDTHQLYTIAVEPLRYEYKGSEFTNNKLSSAIRQDAIDTCRRARDNAVGAFPATNARLQLKPYLPRESQWKEGARWVRCDLNVLMVGSRVDAPELATLPSFAVLKSEIKSQPRDFAFCVNVPGGPEKSAPTDTRAVFARCDKSPDWILKEYIDLDSLGAGVYPTQSELEDSFRQYCQNEYGAPTHLTAPRYPSRADWANNYFFMECWASAPLSHD